MLLPVSNHEGFFITVGTWGKSVLVELPPWDSLLPRDMEDWGLLVMAAGRGGMAGGVRGRGRGGGGRAGGAPERGGGAAGRGWGGGLERSAHGTCKKEKMRMHLVLLFEDYIGYARRDMRRGIYRRERLYRICQEGIERVLCL